MFKGSYVALVTPFKNGRIDEARLKSLVDFHVEKRHGRSRALHAARRASRPRCRNEEHKKVTEIVIEAAKGRLPVIAGCGLELDRGNDRAGGACPGAGDDRSAARGALLQQAHAAGRSTSILRQWRKSSKLPIILYITFPAAAASTALPETVIRLAQDCPTDVVGIKEASGSIDYSSQLMATLGSDRFILFSGDDSLTLPLMAIGAKGVISVIANILPAAMSELCRSWSHGHAGRALELHNGKCSR